MQTFLRISTTSTRLSLYPIRFFTTPSRFERPGPLPLGDPEEQKEFEELVKKQSSAELAVTIEDEEQLTHPDVRREPPPEFEGDKNPVTGEIGGPKRDPLVHGDWSYGSRVTDF
ncbi:11273_t:CDS:1 [Paraglomus brasilianum]|uniref:Succinate dehydrogenase assembly factor 4, mitochondrial n=1 Tax=Paraglomus brasilianum TaxID=144538 RepID=A0A9N9FPD6_9GLOM|nr:11273_t:CDS:1 [Paraglomus brasilianum]